MYHAADALFRRSPTMKAFRAARRDALGAALTAPLSDTLTEEPARQPARYGPGAGVHVDAGGRR